MIGHSVQLNALWSRVNQVCLMSEMVITYGSFFLKVPNDFLISQYVRERQREGEKKSIFSLHDDLFIVSAEELHNSITNTLQESIRL